jgi:hypothetical protein
VHCHEGSFPSRLFSRPQSSRHHFANWTAARGLVAQTSMLPVRRLRPAERTQDHHDRGATRRPCRGTCPTSTGWRSRIRSEWHGPARRRRGCRSHHPEQFKPNRAGAATAKASTATLGKRVCAKILFTFRGAPIDREAMKWVRPRPTNEVRHVAAPHEARRAVVRDREGCNRILDDIRSKTDWPNFYRNAGSPDRVMPVSFNMPLHGGQILGPRAVRAGCRIPAGG